MSKPLIGVLAVQGAFIEHEHILSALGAEVVELRQAADVTNDLDGIVLPGGESSVQGKLVRELGMFEPLRALINQDVPVLATCAGMILLASEVTQGIGSGANSSTGNATDNSSFDAEPAANDPAAPPYFATIPMSVKRNAYGRQLGSFATAGNFGDFENVQMTFIRGPYVESVGDDVQVLATVNDNIVAVRYKNQLAMSFHPELNSDTRIHEMFLSFVN
ncbi:MAG: pyridoxal 5'-phosphate synthase glutaminase subunit PdxT [Phoenicibacter congonensis]|uniref:Pyridoxal 5'-phosphate synthase subunit PdxT n=1 Tax=Phoenicibacter congonensis TaxID=1944646 RepID=A0AA43RIY9_9ACTN|nr:pyridoxal 5'-phosphate synthase glutaminase subunit PdxT [Phoenicibacter congonensis]